MTELEKMISGELYNAGDAELVAARSKARQLFTQYNAASYDDKETKTALLKQLLGSFKGNIDIQSPFYCDYGFNIIAGDNLFLNFNCIILDCARVTFGDNVFLAPNVQLYTAYHPVIAAERIKGLNMQHLLLLAITCGWVAV